MTNSRFEGLEVLAKVPKGKAARHETPLLFIHGAYTAAWCWEEHFLPWFAAQGYPSYALSLSGHGASRGRKQLDSFGISDYVDDVAEAIAALPAPPVLIGHSMGGFVVQKYLERHQAPAAVLMCAVPPQGIMSSAFGLMFQKPGLLSDLNSLMGGGRIAAETLREALFAQPVAEDDLQRYFRFSQRESHRAVWDMTLFNLPHPSRVKNTPLLVLGAEHDHLIPSSLVEMTARTYGVEAEIFPGMGHGLMLERDWRLAADRIHAWLGEQGL
ncbi:MAG: alpha/beta fold hydrolase [Proteobacteria bacterium]|nr:alpha/beta fold hydrolase [Pseudomonadota bacterium]